MFYTTMNQFDKLPLEVIRNCIFPYLDYNGRNAVNEQLLPKKDYIRTQLIHNQIVRVHMMIITHVIKHSLKIVEQARTPYARKRAVLKVFRTIEKYPLIVKHSLVFRKMVEYKCSVYSDPKHAEFAGCSKHFINNMNNLSKNILTMLNTSHTYIEPLSLIKREENFTAVQAGYTSYGPDLFTAKRFA